MQIVILGMLKKISADRPNTGFITRQFQNG